MSHRGVVAFLLAAGLLGSQSSWADSPVAFLTELSEAVELAGAADKPIMAHLSASWCEPCKTMKAELYTQPEIRGALKGFIRVEIDVDTEPGKAMWMSYVVQALPTVLFLAPDGAEIPNTRVTTVPEPEAFQAAMQRALNPENWPREESFTGEGAPPDRRTQYLWFIGCGLLMLSMYMKFKQRSYGSSEAAYERPVRPRPRSRFPDEVAGDVEVVEGASEVDEEDLSVP